MDAEPGMKEGEHGKPRFARRDPECQQATGYPLSEHRAHLYHLHHKRLYQAVGEPDNATSTPPRSHPMGPS